MSLLKSFKIIASLILAAFMLTGCMNSVHLKDLMIVEAMSVDKSGNGVFVGVQTLKLNMTSGGEAPSGNMTMSNGESGDTIVDAVAKLSKDCPKRFFSGRISL